MAGWKLLTVFTIAAVCSDPTSIEQQTQALQKALAQQQRANSDQLTKLARLKSWAFEHPKGRAATLGETKKAYEPATDPANKKALLELKARHPEAGIWAGYETPAEKVEPVTADQIAHEEFRKVLMPAERAHMDAETTVDKVHQEVIQAFKLPGPLAYVAPPLSKWELDERLKENKFKEALKTFKGQQQANERQNKLDNALANGFKVPDLGPRKINKEGIFCTKSLLEAPSLMPAPCKKVKLWCDPQQQKCVFNDVPPNDPQTIQIAEPPILCPGGVKDCEDGEAEAQGDYLMELEYRERKHQSQAIKSKFQADGGIKKLAKIKRLLHDSDSIQKRVLKAEVSGIRDAVITQKVERYPILEKVDPLAELKSKVAAYDHRLAETHKILEELNLLAPDCDTKLNLGLKVRCKVKGQGELALEQAALCQARYKKKYETCVVTKMKMAQAGVSLARQRLAQQTNQTTSLLNKQME